MTGIYRVLLATLVLAVPSTLASAQSSEAAFDQFVSSLQTARDFVVSRTPADGPERAEGLRHIIRLIEMQNATATDDHNVANPHVSRCPGLVCKVGFDNPDFTYINVGPISSEYAYRITGTRGTVPYLSIQIFDNPFGGEIFTTSEELAVRDDGTFEIVLSASPPGDEFDGTWMQLKPGASRFVLRNGFYDWVNEVEASVRVEVISGPMSGPVPHLSVDEFRSDIGGLGARVAAIPVTMQGARDGWPLNDLNDPDPGAFGLPNAGVPTAFSSAGRYEVAVGEALIIETPVPSVIHGGIQLGNAWLESIDYQTRQTSLNWFQSTADADGVIRYVLSHEDPGVSNWLDISGHPVGAIFMRWQSPDTSNLPAKPTVTKIAFDDIAANLPADHPRVMPEERTAALRDRYIAINKRRNPTSQYDEIVVASNQSGAADGGVTDGGECGGASGGGGGCAMSPIRDRQFKNLAVLGVLLWSIACSRRSR